MGGPPGLDAMMTKFFGDIKAFSATGNMSLKAAGDDMTMPMEFAMLEEKVRMDFDLTQMKSAKMPGGMGAQLKQMGMDKMATVMDNTKKSVLIIYPGLKSYVEMPVPKEQAELMQKDIKFETAELGEETIEGHPCKKNKLSFTDEKGKKREALIWNAKDLKNFPIKIQTSQDGNDVTLLYSNIKLEKPEAKLFVTPDDHTKYDNIQALMQGAMMKMFANPPQ